MLAKVRSMLDQLDAMLSEGDQAAADLAAILSALRGPDKEEECCDKATMTSALRALATN